MDAGEHTVQVGAGFLDYQANNASSDGVRRGRFSFSGYYSGDAFADLLFGVPDAATRGAGSDRSDLRRRSWYAFARDEWRIDARLLLTAVSPTTIGSRSTPCTRMYPVSCPCCLSLHLTAGLSSRARLRLKRPDWVRRGPEAWFSRPQRLGSRPRDRVPAFRQQSSGYARFLCVALRPSGTRLLRELPGAELPVLLHTERRVPGGSGGTGHLGPVRIGDAHAARRTRHRTDAPNRICAGLVLPDSGSAKSAMVCGVGIRRDKATHMPRVVPSNVPLPDAGMIDLRRPNPDYGQFSILTGGSSYSSHRMDVAVEHRFADGFALKSGSAGPLSSATSTTGILRTRAISPPSVRPRTGSRAGGFT